MCMVKPNPNPVHLTAVWTASALAAGSVFAAAFSLPFWFAGAPLLSVHAPSLQRAAVKPCSPNLC